MRKNVLLFGANSHVGKAFLEEWGAFYNIFPVFKSKKDQLVLDFLQPNSIKEFVKKIEVSIDAVLFLQGINPSLGISEITEEHFINMFRVNLITPTFIIREIFPKLSKGALILFVSSISKRKGSYDPSYSAAKAAIAGLMNSLANMYTTVRFNSVSLGLIEDSPVFNNMSLDFRLKHSERMFDNSFIKVSNVTSVINLLINNLNINRADFPIDGGYI